MRVRALQSVYYSGRDYRAGEEFETENDMHGKLMVAAKTVEQAQEQDKPQQRGRYNRRDMRAEK